MEAEKSAFKTGETIPLQANRLTKLAIRGEEQGPGEYVVMTERDQCGWRRNPR